MKQMAEQAKEGNLSPTELDVLNDRINNLVEQVRALDSESRKTEYGKILEWASVARTIAADAYFF